MRGGHGGVFGVGFLGEVGDARVGFETGRVGAGPEGEEGAAGFAA